MMFARLAADRQPPAFSNNAHALYLVVTAHFITFELLPKY
jgi:hypothetical protein